MKNIKDEIIKLPAKVLAEINHDLPKYKAIGEALIKVGEDYINQSVDVKIKVNVFMELSDVEAIIEYNSQYFNKKGVIAAIELPGLMYYVVYHFGKNKNMLIKSGDTDRETARDIVNLAIKILIKNDVSPVDIEVYTPFEDFMN